VQAVVEGVPVQPPMEVVAGTQQVNTPLRLEPPTQSLLVKAANGKRMPRQLRSQEQRLDAMQVSVAVHLEWAVLNTPTRGQQVVGVRPFGWHLKPTTSLVLAPAVAVVTPLLVVQVVELQEFLLVVAEVHNLLAVQAVLSVLAKVEPQESNTRVVMRAQ
jgi:hypothetical protein